MHNGTTKNDGIAEEFGGDAKLSAEAEANSFRREEPDTKHSTVHTDCSYGRQD
jgi:hypothetical protein